jgi:hypothetical protein
MKEDLRRLVIVLAAVALWGFATAALSGVLDGVTGFYAASLQTALGFLGIACVREGATLYIPGHRTALTLADTGIYWWGVLIGLAVISRRPPAFRAVAFAGALAALFLIQLAYGIALTVSRHGLILVTQAAWYATFFSLLAMAAVHTLGPGEARSAPSASGAPSPGPGAMDRVSI